MTAQKEHFRWLFAAVAGSAAIAWLATSTGVNGATPRTEPKKSAALGVFLASDARGTKRLPYFEEWLGAEVTVGRTYLPGENWSAFQGPGFILEPWTTWRAAKPGRILALNVPMIAPNESEMPDSTVSVLLTAGAHGAFDPFFERLAQKLVSAKAADTIIVLGWEMNGTTYSSRCAPNPKAWKSYWRRIVTTMRSVPGQNFRFDFAPSRGRDAIPWTKCYPGDDVVDIIGMDSYDQAPGRSSPTTSSSRTGCGRRPHSRRRTASPSPSPNGGSSATATAPTTCAGC